MSAWTAQGDGIVIAVRVTPRAARDSLARGREGQFAARVAAPPVEGAANDAVVALVAKSFGLPRRDVTILSGETGREKRLAIIGDPLALAQAAARLYGAAHDG